MGSIVKTIGSYEVVTDQSIGIVGSAGQLATYGALGTADFPTPASAHVYSVNSNSNDANGTPLNLTQNGTVNFNSVGFFGRENLISFDGTTTYLSTNDSTVYNPTNATSWSIGGWVKSRWQTKNADQRFFVLGGSTSTTTIAAFVSFQGPGGFIQVIKSSGGVQASTGITNTASMAGWIDNSWHHVVLVRTSGAGLALYVDGQLAVSNASETLENSSSNFISTFGRNANASTTFFDGQMQDLFYAPGMALTAAQVSLIYSKRFKGQQLAGGHILDANSFPFQSLSSKVAFFNLSSGTSDGSVNGKNLTNNGSIPFTGANIYGTTSSSAALSTSSHFFSSSDSFFNPGNGHSFAVGAWFRANNWNTNAQSLMSLNESSDHAWIVYANASRKLHYEGSNTAGSADVSVDTGDLGFTDGSWHHIVLAYDYSAQLLKLYVDGTLASSVSQGNIRTQTTTAFKFGFNSTAGTAFAGNIQDAFYIKDHAVTDADIRKLYSARIDLTSDAATLTPTSQNWGGSLISETGQTYTDLHGQSFVTDKRTGHVYVDFGGASVNDPASRVNLRVKGD